MVDVAELRTVTPEVVDAFARLLPQLSASASRLGAADLEAIAGAEATTILVARDDAGTVVGAMTLVVFRIPTGVRAWIEDVVVDEAVRGQGIGEALNRAALEVAGRAGARTVDLTSRPTREDANRLYRKIGFELRETNVYRYNPDADPTVRGA